LLTGQLAELEERNAEVESQNSTVIQQNLELQQVERELRDSLLTFVSRSELQDVQNKLLKSEQERVCTAVTYLCEREPKIEVTHLKHYVRI
jgi:small-conductance mechanosensitive channel